MEEKETEKTPIVTAKSLMTEGPTLHYSHSNVVTFWFFSLVVFVLVCSFWSMVLTSRFFGFDFAEIFHLQNLQLGRFVVEGVSIFEYPWQILVLGLLMAVMSVAPVLVSLLLSFRYSLPFIAAEIIVAGLPGFAVCVLISCFAVATRPLRFRSRFTSISLCMVPQLLYWGLFGGARGAEPVIWGYLFTPWICAWLAGLGLAGVVLGIGHFTRYRPGMVFASTLVVLILAGGIFDATIGFNELDYQLYVVKNNPEQVEEFHSHSITKALDATINNQAVIENLIRAYFYPTEPIALRNELKREILERLSYNSWPWWFQIGPELKFQEKREQLLSQLDKFINSRSQSKRMPIALYYRAISSEYSPDIKDVEQTEVLSFYSDYPHESVRGIWHRLYRDFPASAESIEARWRIAKHWAGLGRFDQADGLLNEAGQMLSANLTELEKQPQQPENIFSPFKPPAGTVMTKSKLSELQMRIGQLKIMISPRNRTSNERSIRNLAKFITLNPHSPQYATELNELIKTMNEKDPLYDNVLLAQTMLTADEQLRAEKLAQLHSKYSKTDGGMEALYELGLSKKRFWSEQPMGTEQRKTMLVAARKTLTSFLSLYPDTIYADRVKKILEDLPKPE